MSIGRELRIGTAGWSVPRAVSDRFPGEGTHLHRYGRVMPAAEINSSFHRPHKAQVYERWAASTPADFRFAVKAPKTLTHDQRLADPQSGLDRFADEIAGLGGRLGPLLVQLPPGLIYDAVTAGRFFDEVVARIATPVVCEPRHPSWFTREVDSWLAARRIARVAADPAKVPGAEEPGGWRGLTYIRLHGSPRVYYSAYAPEVIEAWAERIRAAEGPVWCIFDNTAGSAALGDALTAVAALADGGR